MIQSPGFKDCVLELKAITDYKKNTEICLPPNSSLFVYQYGRQVGLVTTNDSQKIVKLNKSTFKGLKKGFLSKEYKNVLMYWYHHINEFMSFDEKITTAKKHNGKFKFKVRIFYFGWYRAKFDQLISKLNVKKYSDQLVVTLSVIKSIVRERVMEAMPYILENFPNATCVVQKEDPKELASLRTHVQEGLEALGLFGGIHVLPY